MTTTKKQLVNFDQFIKYHFMPKYNNLGLKHFLIIYPWISKSIRQEGLSWWSMLMKNLYVGEIECWWIYMKLCVGIFTNIHGSFHQNSFIFFLNQHTASPTFRKFFSNILFFTNITTVANSRHFFKLIFALGVILYRG